MNEIIANEYLSHKECDSLKGQYLDDSYYDTLITNDTDVYREGRWFYSV